MSMLKGNTILYEAVLQTPGMVEEVKIAFRATRKDILLLSQLIELGLNDEAAISSAPVGTFDGLRTLEAELLNQAKFSPEFIDKWKQLTGTN